MKDYKYIIIALLISIGGFFLAYNNYFRPIDILSTTYENGDELKTISTFEPNLVYNEDITNDKDIINNEDIINKDISNNKDSTKNNNEDIINNKNITNNENVNANENITNQKQNTNQNQSETSSALNNNKANNSNESSGVNINNTIKSNSNTEEISELVCNNYFYAPIGKKRRLPASYIPELKNTGLPGGGRLTPETITALTNMFNDAQSKGIALAIASSYRSFQEQQRTFNYWKQIEINKGLSEKEAEIAANTYSAKPGHSEHQLGTTVDIKCSSCAAFDLSNGNIQVYNYIAENAHKFGFVVSYPPGTQMLTGYIHEPWHIRYVGVDISNDLYNLGYLKGSGDYIEKYLYSKSYCNTKK